MEKKLLNKVAERRKLENYTQLQLAKAVGCGRTTINLIENGKRDPHISTCLKIANVLGVPVCELFTLTL